MKADANTPRKRSSKRCRRVLIVEHDFSALNGTAALFREMGFEVSTESCSLDALAKLMANRHIDTLFADLLMPEINGLELAGEAEKLIPGIEVILTTGYPNIVAADFCAR